MTRETPNLCARRYLSTGSTNAIILDYRYDGSILTLFWARASEVLNLVVATVGRSAWTTLPRRLLNP
jgi:hypothetical protein